MASSPAAPAILALGSTQGTITLWNVAELRVVRTLAAHDSAVAAVAFSGDGHLLASAGDDASIRIWSTASSRPYRSLSSQTRAAALAFTPARDTLTSAGDDGLVRLWSVARGGAPRPFAAHDGAVTGLAISPDGGRLASAGEDGAVRVWQMPAELARQD
jgi:hypothetical protein